MAIFIINNNRGGTVKTTDVTDKIVTADMDVSGIPGFDKTSYDGDQFAFVIIDNNGNVVASKN